MSNCYYDRYKNFSKEKLFPSSESPYLWPACFDAYYYTWTHDPTNHIKYLSQINKEKLARSSGFCPHLRCQLGDLSNSGDDGRCAEGLCYTKLEVLKLFICIYLSFYLSI